MNAPARVRIGVRRALAGEVRREEERPRRPEATRPRRPAAPRSRRRGRRAASAASRPPRASRPSRARCPGPRGRTRARAPAGRRRTRAAPRTRRRTCRGRPTGARAGRCRRRAPPAAWSPAPPISVHSCASGSHAAGQLEQLQHLGAPPAPRDVEEQRPGGVGGVDRALAGEPEADVVLREQDVRDPRVDVRLVPAQPEQLRCGEARERAVAGQLDQAARPTRSSISAHSAAVRWSFQRIAGRSTASSAPSATRPCIWPE